MDTISYLLGKKKGGGTTPTGTINITSNGLENVTNYATANVNVQPNLETKNITITENTTTTITPSQNKDGLSEVVITTNVSGADLSDYFTNTISSGTTNISGFAKMIKTIPSTTVAGGTDLSYAFSGFLGTTIPLIDTSNVSQMSYFFYNCVNITSIPQLNTTNNKSMMGFCQGCTMLSQVPLLNTSSITNARAFSDAFYNCPNLTDQSLDNILQMCINSNATIGGYSNLRSVGLTATNYPTSRIQALPHYQDFINAGWTIGY